LDSVLLEAAAKAGAAVAQGIRVTNVIREGKTTKVLGVSDSGRPFEAEAGVAVGADGRNSIVAQQMHASVDWYRRSELHGWYTYYADMPVDRATWAIGSSTTSGSFPTNDGLACVWAMSDRRLKPQGRYDRETSFLAAIHATSQNLSEEVGNARTVSKIVSFGAHPGYMRRPYGAGWALVGDAACFAHPVTAHGISDSFRDAQLLATAVCSYLRGEMLWKDAARNYAELQRAAIGRMYAVTQRIASLDLNVTSVADIMKEYRSSVQVTARLEDDWWGQCSLEKQLENEEGE
jgi:2-polyprenyl-6-methoxyphenol hydroxylase-like FAD-dependent oxidoreductase